MKGGVVYLGYSGTGVFIPGGTRAASLCTSIFALRAGMIGYIHTSASFL